MILYLILEWLQENRWNIICHFNLGLGPHLEKFCQIYAKLHVVEIKHICIIFIMSKIYYNHCYSLQKAHAIFYRPSSCSYIVVNFHGLVLFERSAKMQV